MTRMETQFRRTGAKRALVCVLVVLVCLLLTCAIAAVWAEGDKLVLVNGTDEKLTEIYETGTEYSLPDNASISETESGTAIAASVILRDPDGNGFTSEKVTLEKAGEYTLEYRATMQSGKLLMAKQRFDCFDSLFSVSSPRSSAEYVESLALHGDIVGGAGISMAVAKGDIFTYNQVLDLSDKTKDDKLITFYVAPETLYDYDAGQINFTLTDAFDRSNYITVTVKRTLLNSAADMHHYSYVTANATGQPATGVNHTVQAQYPTVVVDGKEHALHVSNGYGRAISHSMYGGHDEARDESNYLGKTMSISYDYATKRVYVRSIAAGAEPLVVADFDDPAMFENPWSGFKGGSAILSVSMGSYRALTSHVVITDIAGNKLDDKYAHDNIAPKVEVDLEGYDKNDLPTARVGSDYPLFKATATDETDGEVLCNVSVWYNYASEETRTRVSVNGNSFRPTKPGNYTIVYSAADRAGNEANVTFDLDVENIGELELVHDAAPASVAAGQKYEVTGVTLAGGSAGKKLSVEAVLKTDPNVRYTLGETADGVYSFVPLYAGKYDVTFTYSDWLEEKKETSELDVTAATQAYIPGDAAVPRYVLSGATYDLPALYGYTFTPSPELKACTASVTGGELSGNAFRVTAASGNLTLTYKLSMAGGEEAVKSYDIPVIAGSGVDGEAGTLDMSKLFVQSVAAVAPANYNRVDFACAFTENNYNGRPVFTATNTDKDTMAFASFDFANKVLASRFKTSFALGDGKDFGRVVIYLTDSVNPEQKIKLALVNGGSWKMNFAVNDGYSYATSYTGSSTVEVGFDADHNYATLGNINAPVRTCLSGEEFKGFESGFVYITYQLEGLYKATDSKPTQTAQLRIETINNQTISGIKNDNVDAEVTAYVSRGDLAIGTVTDIPAFYVCDVINPYSTVSVRVTAPSGAVMTSVDGVALDGTQDITRGYEIKLTEYGSYSLSVTGYIGKNKTEFSVPYGFQVLDMSAPTVTFSNAVTQAKVGDTVKFADVSVKDDTTKGEDIKVTVYLMTPSGKIVSVDKASYGSFVASEVGEYRVIVYACDEGNRYGSATVSNTAIEWYTVTVTA